MAKQSQYYYFKQVADIDNVTKGIFVFRGSYDGNGYSISIAPDYKGVISLFVETLGNTVLNDITTRAAENGALSLTTYAECQTSLTISNCTAEMQSGVSSVKLNNVGNFGFFIYYFVQDNRQYAEDYADATLPTSELTGRQTVTLDNCVVNANVQNTGTCTGGFIGSGYLAGSTIENSPLVTIRNCTFNGYIIGNNQAGLIFGNSAYNSSINDVLKNYADDQIEKSKELFVLKNIQLNGTVTADQANLFSGTSDFVLNQAYLDIVSEKFTNRTGNELPANLTVGRDGTGAYTINDNQYRYQLVFKVSAIYLNESKTSYSNGRDILINLTSVENNSNSQIVTTSGYVIAYDTETAKTQPDLTADDIQELNYCYNCENHKVAVLVKNGKTYLIFSNDTASYVNTKDRGQSVQVYVYAFDNTGRFVGKKSINQTAATNSTDNSLESSQPSEPANPGSTDPSTSDQLTVPSTTTEAGGGSGTSAPMETDPSNSPSSTDASTTVTDLLTPEDGNDGQEASTPTETDNASEETEQVS